MGNLQRQIKELKILLAKLNLKPLQIVRKEESIFRQKFKNKNFYRLQKIESLYQNHFLSDDLRWLQPGGERQ